MSIKLSEANTLKYFWEEKGDFTRFTSYDDIVDKLKEEYPMLFEGVNRIKQYSPLCCTLEPRAINSLLADNASIRGSNYQGVYFNTKTRKLQASLSCYGKSVWLGVFDTEREAFLSYKETKESYIKAVAMSWKGKVEDTVFTSLLQYELELPENLT